MAYWEWLEDTPDVGDINLPNRIRGVIDSSPFNLNT